MNKKKSKRPIRIIKNKKGQRYIIINGKKYKIKSDLSDKQLFKIVTNIKIKIKNKGNKKRNVGLKKEIRKLTPNKINYSTILLNDTKEQLKKEREEFL
jgi:hypothetical protein